MPKPLILVVEDDDDVRALLSELLQPRYAVEAVGNGVTATPRTDGTDGSFSRGALQAGD